MLRSLTVAMATLTLLGAAPMAQAQVSTSDEPPPPNSGITPTWEPGESGIRSVDADWDLATDVFGEEATDGETDLGEPLPSGDPANDTEIQIPGPPRLPADAEWLPEYNDPSWYEAGSPVDLAIGAVTDLLNNGISLSSADEDMAPDTQQSPEAPLGGPLPEGWKTSDITIGSPPEWDPNLLGQDKPDPAWPKDWWDQWWIGHGTDPDEIPEPTWDTDWWVDELADMQPEGGESPPDTFELPSLESWLDDASTFATVAELLRKVVLEARSGASLSPAAAAMSVAIDQNECTTGDVALCLYEKSIADLQVAESIGDLLDQLANELGDLADGIGGGTSGGELEGNAGTSTPANAPETGPTTGSGPAVSFDDFDLDDLTVEIEEEGETPIVGGLDGGLEDIPIPQENQILTGFGQSFADEDGDGIPEPIGLGDYETWTPENTGDADGDGIDDVDDVFPNDKYNGSKSDSDGDGTPDDEDSTPYGEPDSDGDGTSDSQDDCSGDDCEGDEDEGDAEGNPNPFDDDSPPCPTCGDLAIDDPSEILINPEIGIVDPGDLQGFTPGDDDVDPTPGPDVGIVDPGELQGFTPTDDDVDPTPGPDIGIVHPGDIGGYTPEVDGDGGGGGDDDGDGRPSEPTGPVPTGGGGGDGDGGGLIATPESTQLTQHTDTTVGDQLERTP